MVPDFPQSHAEEWELWAKQVREAIHAGYLDLELKSIAEECVKRNKALAKGTATTRKPEVSPPFPALMALDAAPGPTPVQKPQTTSKPQQRHTGGRRFVRHSDPTFRYVDGRLYNRSDVVGKVMAYQDDSGSSWIAIRGVGPKAAKVEFTDRRGVKLTDPLNVPAKYRDGKSQTGIKDPIFMGLKVIQPIIDHIDPVQE